MPYSGPGDSKLPDNVKKLPENKRAQWVEIFNSAFDRCQENGGDNCEGAAFRQANGKVMTNELLTLKNNQAAPVQKIVHNGKETLVVPVVAIFEGVLNGEFIPANELAKSVEGWNGRPVVLNHPQDKSGRYISANSPDVPAVGQIYNARLDEGKLKYEAWLDTQQAKKLGGDYLRLLNAFEAGKLIEGSTGYFRDLEPGEGEYQGKAYHGIARNILPDHYAFLLHTAGACSVDDGCGGPRVNQNLTLAQMDTVVREAWQKDNGGEIINVYPDRIDVTTNEGLFAYPYSVNDDKIEFDKPQQYQLAGNERQPNENTIKSVIKQFLGLKEQVSMSKKDTLVQTLAANEKCQLSEDTLNKLDEPELEALQKTLAAQDESPPPAEPQQAEPEPEGKVAKLEAMVTSLTENVTSLTETVKSLKDGLQANSNQEREALIAEIAANQSAFTREALEKKDVVDLRSIRQLLNVPDYSGRAFPAANNGEWEDYETPEPAVNGKGDK